MRNPGNCANDHKPNRAPLFILLLDESDLMCALFDFISASTFTFNFERSSDTISEVPEPDDELLSSLPVIV